jgi:hypothetical protein
MPTGRHRRAAPVLSLAGGLTTVPDLDDTVMSLRGAIGVRFRLAERMVADLSAVHQRIDYSDPVAQIEEWVGYTGLRIGIGFEF